MCGGNESRSLMTAAGGSEVLAISIPSRYLHSPACVADEKDIENTLELLRLLPEAAGAVMIRGLSYDDRRLRDLPGEPLLATMVESAARCCAWDSFMSSGAFTRDWRDRTPKGVILAKGTRPVGKRLLPPKRRRRSWIFCNGGRRAG